MAFCSQCGTQFADNTAACPKCGAANPAFQQQPGQQQYQQQYQQPGQQQYQQQYQQPGQQQYQQPGQPYQFDPADISQNKVMAVLAYFGPLVLIPIFAAPNSKYARYHSNQGLILLIASIIVSVVGSVIPFLGWFVILPIGSLIVFVLAVIGIINAATGKAKDLPIIGKIKILK